MVIFCFARAMRLSIRLRPLRRPGTRGGRQPIADFFSGCAGIAFRLRYGFLVACSVLLYCSCGYHVAGRADLLPKRINTIAVPAFANVTTRYRLADRLSADITREFISRTRYNIVSDPNQADAVLTGAVVNFFGYPTILDPATGRATGVQAIVILQINLVDRKDGAVLFSRPNMEVRERYEISVDPNAYFDESGAAMDRLSRDVARTVVSAILENF
jgi:Lipopolysaccharide-assembly